jgi:kynurenine formamidase
MEILGADTPIAENLTNLASITWPNPWVSMLPLKIESGDGAPIRAMAIDWAHD